MIEGIASTESDNNSSAGIEIFEPHPFEKSPSGFRYRGLTFSADSPENAPSILAWKDMTVSVGQGEGRKLLLNNISGTITGGLWAIMGPSGVVE